MKTSARILVTALLSLVIVNVAFGWGNATHVYFAKQLGAKTGFTNMNEMYGCLLPDTYNLMFDEKGQYLYQALHYDFMKFYTSATMSPWRSIAVGFVSHNGLWGADYTAHHKGFTTPTGGYAVVKGKVLALQLVSPLVDILAAAGVPAGDASYIAGLIAPEMGHDLVETGVDILVKRNLDPAVGVRMAAAAKARPLGVGTLLASTYAAGLAQATGITRPEAEALIIQGEVANADAMAQYGMAFSLPENLTITLLSQQIAPIAAEYIKANTGIEVTINSELVATFIGKAIAVVEADYLRELARTLAKVEIEMLARGIRGPIGIFAKEDASAEESTDHFIPSRIELLQNYPNPFNPTTTIAFTLPGDTHVSIMVYNLLGEQVAMLANEVRSAGTHSVVWNADAMPSGTYVYRIDAGGVQQTRKMNLLR